MSYSLLPDFCFDKITDIDPQFFIKYGIQLLMLDLDNTIAPYDSDDITEDVMEWCRSVKRAGVTLYFVSNSKKPGRVESFAAKMEVGFITNASKPSTRVINNVLRLHGISPRNAALAGDQIFTDVHGANMADIMSLLVTPITFEPQSISNRLRHLRFIAEMPFRIFSKNRVWRLS